jgi:type IV secretory pathway VirD2 relaxase
LIVAPEDGKELGNLRSFTRQLMQKMGRGLDTELDWIAVDHPNTVNPQTDIVIRG